MQNPNFLQIYMYFILMYCFFSNERKMRKSVSSENLVGSYKRYSLFDLFNDMIITLK